MKSSRLARVGMFALLGFGLFFAEGRVLTTAAGPGWSDSGPKSTLPGGFTLARSFTDYDTWFLESGLGLLRQEQPDWYRYVAEAGPLELAIEPEDGGRGLAAKSRCCDPLGNGLVIFADHLDHPALIGGELDSTLEGRQLAFLGTLIHEVTHIRERRAGRLPERPEFSSCVAAEKSAFAQELAFKRAMAWPGKAIDQTAGGLYQRTARHQLEAGTKAVQMLEAWDFFCYLLGRELE